MTDSNDDIYHSATSDVESEAGVQPLTELSPFSFHSLASTKSLTDDTAFFDDESDGWDLMPDMPAMLVQRREARRARGAHDDDAFVIVVDPDDLPPWMWSAMSSESDEDTIRASWFTRVIAEPAMRRLHHFGFRWPTAFYALSQLCDQLLAILPILLWVLLFRLVFLDHGAVDNAGLVLGGLALVTVGLFLFMEGLNFAMMPLGEVIGKHMSGVHAALVYLFVFVLGVLVTLCEPAINALQTLGNMVTARKAPFLHFLVHNWVDFWFVTVAVGVGLASALGLLRIRRRWPLKPLIVVLVTIALVLSCVGVWVLGGDLENIVALAWDCGGITTGPVTVPILIAFGIGTGAGRASASATDGFGIVTLSTLVPVIAVILQGMLLVSLYTRGELLALLDAPDDTAVAGGISVIDSTPWQERDG